MGQKDRARAQHAPCGCGRGQAAERNFWAAWSPGMPCTGNKPHRVEGRAEAQTLSSVDMDKGL